MRLDTREGATEDLGGAAAIAPGHPEKSEIMARLTTTDEEDRMPPVDTGKTVSPQEIDLIRRWIAEGANYARHWSYEPPRRVELPPVKNTAWPKGALDRFVLARLEAAGLRPQPEADRAALARRVALDLTGLPPSLEELGAFEQDSAQEAYERFVDRQLAKPASWLHLRIVPLLEQSFRSSSLIKIFSLLRFPLLVE